MKKRIFARTAMALTACAALISAYSAQVSAYSEEFFDYDKYANNDRYEVRISFSRVFGFNWDSSAETEKTITLKYEAFDNEPDDEIFRHYAEKQDIDLFLKIPDEYTSYFTRGREAWIYDYEKHGDLPEKVSDEKKEANFNLSPIKELE